MVLANKLPDSRLAQNETISEGALGASIAGQAPGLPAEILVSLG